MNETFKQISNSREKLHKHIISESYRTYIESTKPLHFIHFRKSESESEWQHLVKIKLILATQ